MFLADVTMLVWQLQKQDRHGPRTGTTTHNGTKDMSRFQSIFQQYHIAGMQFQYIATTHVQCCGLQ